eukprot:7012776-Prymnesium_polylepis.2
MHAAGAHRGGVLVSGCRSTHLQRPSTYIGAVVRDVCRIDINRRVATHKHRGTAVRCGLRVLSTKGT